MIYETVVKYAEKRGMTIQDVEKKAGLGNGTIGKWKDNKTSPTFENMAKVAAALDISPITLIKARKE